MCSLIKNFLQILVHLTIKLASFLVKLILCFPYGCDTKICLYNTIFIVAFYREEDNTNTAARSASHIVLHAG